MADTEVTWPLSTSPGQKPQEGAGRLINVFAEPRGEGLAAVWHRVPGARVFATDPPAGTAIGDSDARATGTGSGAGSAQGDSTATGHSI